MNENIRKIASEVKKIWYIPAAIALGVVLMSVQFNQNESVPVADTINADQYAQHMELCVYEMLQGIDGVGECEVTITLADSGRREYVRENGEVLVVTDEQGNQSAVVANENVPSIAGVTIAGAGVENVLIREKIIQAVSTLLGIGTNKVCVVLNGG